MTSLFEIVKINLFFNRQSFVFIRRAKNIELRGAPAISFQRNKNPAKTRVWIPIPKCREGPVKIIKPEMSWLPAQNDHSVVVDRDCNEHYKGSYFVRDDHNHCRKTFDRCSYIPGRKNRSGPDIPGMGATVLSKAGCARQQGCRLTVRAPPNRVNQARTATSSLVGL